VETNVPAPKGNKNAAIKPGDKRHGFYAQDMSEDEAAIYDEAKTVSLLEEVALCRTRLRRLHKWSQDPDNEITEGTLYQMDRMLSRVGDLTTKVSIIERNARESGALDEDDPTGMVRTIERIGAHRTTFKNGKANGNGKARNG